jgi:hypothetical protein
VSPPSLPPQFQSDLDQLLFSSTIQSLSLSLTLFPFSRNGHHIHQRKKIPIHRNPRSTSNLCFTILLFTNTSRYPLFLYSSSSSDTPIHPSSPSAPATPPPKNDTAPVLNADFDFDLNWKLCKGAVAVDYIPCLDNFKAIKALKSRRHMEHRERHCPDPSPRCLVPLPGLRAGTW